jgi:hypothetical protein
MMTKKERKEYALALNMLGVAFININILTHTVWCKILCMMTNLPFFCDFDDQCI